MSEKGIRDQQQGGPHRESLTRNYTCHSGAVRRAEPGTHEHGLFQDWPRRQRSLFAVRVHGFRAHRCAMPRNDRKKALCKRLKRISGQALRMTGVHEIPKETVILRSPQSGRLEGRAEPDQAWRSRSATETPRPGPRANRVTTLDVPGGAARRRKTAMAIRLGSASATNDAVHACPLWAPPARSRMIPNEVGATSPAENPSIEWTPSVAPRCSGFAAATVPAVSAPESAMTAA